MLAYDYPLLGLFWSMIAKLADLHEQGILTEDEFAAQKARLLG